MIDAMILFAGSSPTVVFSPWFPRQADMLRVVAGCVALSGSCELMLDLFSKSSEDVGDGVAVDATTHLTLSAVGISSPTEWRTVAGQNGVEQLLRFRYTVSGSAANDWILFRLLPAVWFDAVNVGP